MGSKHASQLVGRRRYHCANTASTACADHLKVTVTCADQISHTKSSPEILHKTSIKVLQLPTKLPPIPWVRN